MGIKENALREWLLDYAQKEGLSGIIEIIDKDKVIFKEYLGYANKEEKTPITDDTRFRLYSMTKFFVAIAIMKLYDQGKVDIYAHPGEYLECAKKLDDRLTLENIMLHRSGLYEISSAEDQSVKRDVDFEEDMIKLCEKPMYFAPGEKERYTNTNFIIMSMILEKFHNMPLKEYLENVLFKEFGMKTACCDEGDTEIENMAIGYEKVDGKIQRIPYVNLKLASGAAFGVGTIRDVEALYDIVRNRKILSEKAWELVLRKPEDGYFFGFGCVVDVWNGKLIYQQNGGHYGFRSMQRYLPNEDFAILALTNVGFEQDLRDIVCEKIHEIYFGESKGGPKFVMDKGFANK